MQAAGQPFTAGATALTGRGLSSNVVLEISILVKKAATRRHSLRRAWIIDRMK